MNALPRTVTRAIEDNKALPLQPAEVCTLTRTDPAELIPDLQKRAAVISVTRERILVNTWAHWGLND